MAVLKQDREFFFEKLTTKAGFYDEKASKNAYFGLLQLIFSELHDRNYIDLPDFGRFSIVKRKSRNFRNVKTGVIEVLPAKKELHFDPHLTLKAQIRGMAGRMDDVL